MNLSFKDIQFIVEAIELLIEKYQERLKQIEDIDEDEASDLGNDTMFLESLRRKLGDSLNKNISPEQISSLEEEHNKELANNLEEDTILIKIIKNYLQSKASLKNIAPFNIKMEDWLRRRKLGICLEERASMMQDNTLESLQELGLSYLLKKPASKLPIEDRLILAYAITESLLQEE